MAISPSSVTVNGVTATISLSGSTVTVKVSSTSLYWRVRGQNPDTKHYITETRNSSASFTATDGKNYVFQVCTSSGSWTGGTNGLFTVEFDFTLSISQGTGTTITVKRGSTTLSNGATLQKGDSLSITISAKTGYDISSRSHSNGTYTVSGNVSVYATATVKSFSLSISAGTGSSITVNRTSSPKQGATTGNLSNGATIYYSDVLKITFSASTGYEIGTHTVNGSDFTSGSTHTVTAAVKVVSTANILGLVYIDNGVSFEAYLVYIDNGTSWDQYIPYCDNGISWDMCY